MSAKGGKLRRRAGPRPSTGGRQAERRAAEKIGVIAGDLQDAESMKARSRTCWSLGVGTLDCRQDGAALGRAARSAGCSTDHRRHRKADAVLIVGANPRLEAPVLNARLRKRWLAAADFPIGVIGEQADLTYPTTTTWAPARTLAELPGKATSLKASRTPSAGDHRRRRARWRGADGAAVQGRGGAPRRRRTAGTAGTCCTRRRRASAASTSASCPGEGGKTAPQMAGKGGSDVLFLLGADEIDALAKSKAFVVYLGTHGDAGAHRADVILPGAAYTEKNGLYVNTEGRVQMGVRAVFPKGEARRTGRSCGRCPSGSARSCPTTPGPAARQAVRRPPDLRPHRPCRRPGRRRLDLGKLGKKLGGKLSSDEAPFASPVKDFYLTNPIARASVTMAECAAVASGASKIAAE
jgi:NADH-quinone oxidoreductase subunit G